MLSELWQQFVLILLESSSSSIHLKPNIYQCNALTTKKGIPVLSFIIIHFFTFRTILLVIVFAIHSGWLSFRSYVQVKVYRVVKQNESDALQSYESIPPSYESIPQSCESIPPPYESLGKVNKCYYTHYPT